MGKIALAGTFDVENYGDCLFPIVAEWRLRALGHEVFSVSPTSNRTRWRDSPAPIAVSELFGQSAIYDGVIVGGGNIIHNQPDYLEHYVKAQLAPFAYTSLWLGTTLACALRGRPIAWNAPGVPRRPSCYEQRELIPAIAATTAYLSVRDTASREMLGEKIVNQVSVVPDTAVELSSVWSKKDLEPVFRRLLERKGHRTPESRFVSIHIKERALQKSIKQTAKLLDDFARRARVTPILLALAPCHGDDKIAALLSAEMRQTHLLLDDSDQLREIAAAIAWSEAYAGSSLHGYITSYSYNVPGIVVARPFLPKFAGFMAQVGREEKDLVDSWEVAFQLLLDRLISPQFTRNKEVNTWLQSALDTHWRDIDQSMYGEKSVSEERFIHYFANEGWRRGGFHWAFEPLKSPYPPDPSPAFHERLRSRLRRYRIIRIIIDKLKKK